MEPIAARVVAEHILWLRREIDTTPMQVLKLVYLSHGWTLGFHSVPLIADPVEAWTYGPVVPAVYHRYKKFGGGLILGKYSNHAEQLASRAQAMIELVERGYRHCTGTDLSRLTHQPNTPWDVTRRRSGIGSVIPNPLILEHYRAMAYSS